MRMDKSHIVWMCQYKAKYSFSLRQISLIFLKVSVEVPIGFSEEYCEPLRRQSPDSEGSPDARTGTPKIYSKTFLRGLSEAQKKERVTEPKVFLGSLRRYQTADFTEIATEDETWFRDVYRVGGVLKSADVEVAQTTKRLISVVGSAQWQIWICRNADSFPRFKGCCRTKVNLLRCDLRLCGLHMDWKCPLRNRAK
jgi:hypothetical protein